MLTVLLVISYWAMLIKTPIESLLFWAGGTPLKDPSLVSPRCRGDPPSPLFLGHLTFSEFSAFKNPRQPQNPRAFSCRAIQVRQAWEEGGPKLFPTPSPPHPNFPPRRGNRQRSKMQLVSSWLVTQLIESPSGRLQPEHRNTSGLSSSSAGSAASSRRFPSAQPTDAFPLTEFHMFAHFCSSWWRLESSESRLPNREESPHLPLSPPHVQLVEEHPLQQLDGQAPAIPPNGPRREAPREMRACACAGRGGAGRGGGGRRGAVAWGAEPKGKKRRATR